MTYKEIVSMARQAGCEESWGGDCFRFSEIELERFAALVAEAEREVCARLCEDNSPKQSLYLDSHRISAAIHADIAHAIRSRGTHEPQ